MKGKMFKRLTACALAFLMASTALPSSSEYLGVFKSHIITANAIGNTVTISADGQTVEDDTTWTNCIVYIAGNGSVTFSERITISGTVTINLAEGTELIAPKGIEVDKGNTLTIEGNGTLNASADKFYAAIGRGFHDSTSGTSGTININSGNITATGGRFAAAIGGGYEGVSGTINISGGTIVATGGYCAAAIGGGTFARCGVVNISGGQVTANGDRASGIGPGFDAEPSGDITLGLTKPTDSIRSNRYYDYGTVVLTVPLTDGTNLYSGTLTEEQISELDGKTLVPAYAVNLPESTTGGSISADKSFVAANAEDKTVTLNVAPEEGYAVKSVSVNGEVIEPVEGVYSFTMPAEDVTVSAEFEELTGAYISGASLSLNGEISVNLFIKPSATLGEGAHVMVKGPNDTYAQKVMIDDSTYRADKQAYLISAPVYAAQMGEQVEFTLYNSADEPQKLWNTARTKSYDTYTYSVKNYIDKAKTQKDDNNVPTKLAVLAEKMENYGAWSTTYMLKTGKVDAGTALIATPTEITGITDETVEGKKIAKSNNCTVSGINVTLCLDSQTAIRLYYSGDEIKDISATRDGSAVTVNTGYSEEKQKYYVEIPNVAAQYLDDDYVVSFGDKGDVTVSGFSYVYLALKYSDDTDLKNVVRAIYKYNRAAEDFFVS